MAETIAQHGRDYGNVHSRTVQEEIDRTIVNLTCQQFWRAHDKVLRRAATILEADGYAIRWADRLRFEAIKDGRPLPCRQIRMALDTLPRSLPVVAYDDGDTSDCGTVADVLTLLGTMPDDGRLAIEGSPVVSVQIDAERTTAFLIVDYFRATDND